MVGVSEDTQATKYRDTQHTGTRQHRGTYRTQDHTAHRNAQHTGNAQDAEEKIYKKIKNKNHVQEQKETKDEFPRAFDSSKACYRTRRTTTLH